MKIKFFKRLSKMPIEKLFDVNISKTSNSFDDFYDFVVSRCQKELGINEKNYFKVKGIVLGWNKIYDETIEIECEGEWMGSEERKAYQFNKKYKRLLKPKKR